MVSTRLHLHVCRLQFHDRVDLGWYVSNRKRKCISIKTTGMSTVWTGWGWMGQSVLLRTWRSPRYCSTSQTLVHWDQSIGSKGLSSESRDTRTTLYQTCNPQTKKKRIKEKKEWLNKIKTYSDVTDMHWLVFEPLIQSCTRGAWWFIEPLFHICIHNACCKETCWLIYK